MSIVWFLFLFLQAILKLFCAFLRLFACFLKLNKLFDLFLRICRVVFITFMYLVFLLEGKVLFQWIKLLLHVHFLFSFRTIRFMDLTFRRVSDVIDQDGQWFNHDFLSRSLIIRENLMLGEVKSFKEIIRFVDNTFSFSILRWLLIRIKGMHLN